MRKSQEDRLQMVDFQHLCQSTNFSLTSFSPIIWGVGGKPESSKPFFGAPIKALGITPNLDDRLRPS